MENKRPGYVDFTGRITITTPKKHKLVLESFKSGEKPLSIYFSSQTQKIKIYESRGIYSINDLDYSFNVEYQSQLTNLVYEQLQQYNNCDLVSYSQSKQEHIMLLKAFNKFLNGRGGAIT